MRLPLFSSAFASIIALAAGVATAHAAPAVGPFGASATSHTNVQTIAYRTVCNNYGNNCRRVWVDEYRYDDGARARAAELARQRAADQARLREIAAERARALAIKEQFARGRPVVVQGGRRNDVPERQGGQER